MPATPPRPASSWHYPDNPVGARDLRVDFLRGIAMIVMVVAHIEVFSVLNLLTSERFGLVSGAEGFVIFSGLVLGSVYRSRVPHDGWITTIYRLWSRAWKLYVVSLCLIIAIYLLALVPFIDAREVVSFTDRGAGISYPLYPTDAVNLPTALNLLFYLQVGPHQTQVLGLYVFLLLATPVMLALFNRGKAWLGLGLSWILYAAFQWHHFRLLDCNFENAFALPAWQLIFFHGLAVGWFKVEIASYMHGRMKTLVVGASLLIAIALAFLAQNHTNPFLPEWARLHAVPAEVFDRIYNGFARKNTLGPLRVLNDVSLFISLYWLLTVCWKPFYRLFGWYLVPVGQASLYVFILHVFVVLAASQLVRFDLHPDRWLAATAIHAAALMSLWWMTRKRFLMRIIPT